MWGGGGGLEVFSRELKKNSGGVKDFLEGLRFLKFLNINVFFMVVDFFSGLGRGKERRVRGE